MNVFEPNDPFLKKYVDTIYIFEKGTQELKYTSYPSANTAVGLFRNASIEYFEDHIAVKGSAIENHFGIAFNRLFRPVNLHYEQMVDEIAINFKPLGFATFAQWQYSDNETDCFAFTTWDKFLQELFNSVFATEDTAERSAIIETFLLNRYARIHDEEMLTQACVLLADPDNERKMEGIAKLLGIHYKYLYRSFMQHIGCSPAHYRKITRFRNAVYSKLDQGDALRFIELCYSNNYTDQPHFNKQFQEITGENPKKFFRDVSAFGKVVFRFF